MEIGPGLRKIKYILLARLVIAVIAGILAVAYWYDFKTAKEIVDEKFIALLFIVVIALLVKWENIRWDKLSRFKAGPLEVGVENEKLERTLERLDTQKIEDQQLRAFITENKEKLGSLRGSRILWIDDNSQKLLGARRLLRALGMEVVMVNSSEMAENTLIVDNDFDLIITDVQRQGKSYEYTGGITIHEGVNFIVKRLLSLPDDFIKSIPIIFYAAYDWKRLVEFTEAARKNHPNVDICNDFLSLIRKLVLHLEESKARPIIYRTRKEPTAIYPKSEEVE